MENATKALIIAGSVLIVIILIAVGIQILGSTQGVTNEVNSVSSAMGQAVFNSQFTDYVGRQTGTQVRALLSKVIANNSNNSRKISITGYGNTASQIESARANISLTGSYTVTVGYDTNTGYVNSITIQ